MFNRLFHFLKGYVIIEIYGEQAERFLSICAKRGINIFNIQRTNNNTFTLRMQKCDFFKIRPVAYKTHTRVKILKKTSAYNLLNKYKNRYTFFAGMCFCVLFFAITSRYIWVIEINGVYEADYSQIEQILKNDGVYVGAKKKNIKDKQIIKQSLVNETENIAWAWLYIEGAKARVEIYEKNLASVPVDSDEICDIVAARDGYVTTVTVINGHNMRKQGSAVNQGDVLISGKVPIFRQYEEERYTYVHAQGTVKAITYHEKDGIYSLSYESKIPTGRKKRYFSLEMFGKLYNSFEDVLCPYENCVHTFSRHELKIPYFGYSGICLNERVCLEAQIKKEPLSEAVAVEFAKNDLEEKIAKELLKDAQLINSEIDYEKISENSIRVTLKMTVLEDIGVLAPIQKEE